MSDFLIFASANLVSPIFAIFVIERISSASLETIGICASIYYITKSILEMFVGKYIDKTKSEKDDLYTALIGTILTAIVFLSYCFITSIWQLYVAQCCLGIGAALAYPGWYSIFTTHIDGDKKGVEWSLYDVIMGIGIALSATLGAFMADIYGFNVLFIVIAIGTVLGSIMLLTLKNKIRLK